MGPVIYLIVRAGSFLRRINIPPIVQFERQIQLLPLSKRDPTDHRRSRSDTTIQLEATTELFTRDSLHEVTVAHQVERLL